jgi:hypothetical protein
MTKAFGGVGRAQDLKTLKTDFSERLELFDKLGGTVGSGEIVIMSKADHERMEKTKSEFESQKNLIPVYELKETFPRLVTFNSAKCAYLKVDATLKFFPLHFTVTNDEDEFMYYVNFNASRAPTADVHDLKIEARGNFGIMPTPAIAAKYLKQEKCGSQMSNVVVIGSLWILVDTFYVSDCWMSYSFSSAKY